MRDVEKGRVTTGLEANICFQIGGDIGEVTVTRLAEETGAERAAECFAGVQSGVA